MYWFIAATSIFLGQVVGIGNIIPEAVRTEFCQCLAVTVDVGIPIGSIVLGCLGTQIDTDSDDHAHNDQDQQDRDQDQGNDQTGFLSFGRLTYRRHRIHSGIIGRHIGTLSLRHLKRICRCIGDSAAGGGCGRLRCRCRGRAGVGAGVGSGAGAAASGAAMGFPQVGQNFLPSSTAVPHFLQVMFFLLIS